MSALLAVLLLVGLVALLERTHRRAHALDHAPGRPESADDARARAELAGVPGPVASRGSTSRRGAWRPGATASGARRPGAAA
ncbi:hypothetical protein [Barrientosiimonas endolithica]|uniref:Uncharacterized protein n=1 Tax=Barrientosiimonas endolithica TaxID=1535208 RepID=A0ABM8HFF2_9MICO|nr:hypothetical protein [Barrientosiimonas endolithica]BDZ59721.1 hypothetical protein GCM10025872_33780 [Barrientosiimonas endolithica]